MELKDLRGLVVVVMIIGLLLGVGFMLLKEFSDNMADTVGTVTNETIAFSAIMGSGGTFPIHNGTTGSLWNCFNKFSLTHMYNKSGDTILINTGNYSFYPTTGRIWNTTPLPTGMITDWLLADVVVSYTHDYSNSTGCEGMEETIEATEKIQEWLGILVIMFIVGILLFIVYRFSGGSMGVPEGGKMKFGKFKGFGRSGGDSGSAEI